MKTLEIKLLSTSINLVLQYKGILNLQMIESWPCEELGEAVTQFYLSDKKIKTISPKAYIK